MKRCARDSDKNLSTELVYIDIYHYILICSDLRTLYAGLVGGTEETI